MPKLKIDPSKRFTSWSFSRYKDHRECARKAYLKHLAKWPLPPMPKAPALLRGELKHKEAEDFTKGRIRILPPEFNTFKKDMQELRKQKALCEGKWAVTVAWEVIDYFNWAKAWCRVVLDAHYCPTPKLARVIDHKTGRIYPDNEEQMELYAIVGFAHYPNAEQISTELWYHDQPRVAGVNPKIVVFHRRQLTALQRKWKLKIIPLLTDKKFIPRPGDYCSRCDYSVRKLGKSGPCEY